MLIIKHHLLFIYAVVTKESYKHRELYEACDNRLLSIAPLWPSLLPYDGPWDGTGSSANGPLSIGCGADAQDNSAAWTCDRWHSHCRLRSCLKQYRAGHYEQHCQHLASGPILLAVPLLTGDIPPSSLLPLSSDHWPDRYVVKFVLKQLQKYKFLLMVLTQTNM